METKLGNKKLPKRELYKRKKIPRIKEDIIHSKLMDLKKRGFTFRSGKNPKNRYSQDEAAELKKISEEVQEELIVKTSFPKQKCAFISESGKGCSKVAIGDGLFCYNHGGEVVKETLLTNEEVQVIPISKLKEYKPDFHPYKFLELSKEGMADVEIAAEFMVSVRTLQSWIDLYEDFAEAYGIGQSLYEAWWLKEGKEALDKPRSFNFNMFKYLTSNKLGYSEKTESKNTQVNYGVLVVPGQQSMLEWEQKRLPEKSGDIIDVTPS